MKQRLISLLKRSERYTKTDMVYFASGAFWGNFNSFVVALLAFIGSIFFAHFLTKDQYGTYQYVLSIAGLIGSLTLTGMNAAVTRAIARGHEGELKHSVRYQLIAGIIPMLAGLCVSFWYLAHGNQSLATAFAIVAVFLPLSNAYNTWIAYFGGKKMFRVGSYYGTFNNIVGYVPIIIAIYIARDYVWVVFANYFFVFLSSLILYHHMLRHYPPNEVRDNETLPYGTHLSLMGILSTAAGQLDSLMVFHFLGSAPLAVYSFATIIPERLAGMLKFIPNIAMPKLATYDLERTKATVAKKIWVLMGLIAAAVVAYALLSPLLFHIFFPAYSDSIPFTRLYSLTFFSLAASFMTTVLTSQKNTKELYVVNFINPSIRIALLAVLMFYAGIWGLLWAQIISNFVSFSIQLALFVRSKPTKPATL